MTETADIALSTGFPPIVDARARVLILGSMPGVASLEAGQYYAHERNAFWPIMGELFGAGFDLPYEERTERLREAGIAVWDVLKSCHRPGSLDSAIDDSTAVVNDFGSFFRRHRRVRRVLFNGHKAATVYRKKVLPDVTLKAPYLEHSRLPSTSPAHAAMRFDAKLEAWRTGLCSARVGEERS